MVHYIYAFQLLLNEFKIFNFHITFTHDHIYSCTAILVRLSQLMYQVTEGPLLGPAADVMVCATIQLGSLGRDVSVNLVTPATGPAVIGKSQFESCSSLNPGTHCTLVTCESDELPFTKQQRKAVEVKFSVG